MIGLGASAPTYYPHVAERLGTDALIPDHAGVANAVGAVVGRIRVTAEASISQPEQGRYRVYSSQAPRDFAKLDDAAGFAETILREDARAGAIEAGAGDIEIRIGRDDKTAVIEGKKTGDRDADQGDRVGPAADHRLTENIMTDVHRFKIAVLPGDGIGIEVMEPCLALLETVAGSVGGFSLDFNMLEAGAGTYRDTGTALPEATLEAARAADAILLGAMGLPDIRYPDGTEIAPQIDLRGLLGLYAGVRPMRKVRGIPSALADPRAEQIDFVLIRESTEGLFYSHGKGVVDGDREARETMVITRETSERLFRFAFRLAKRRKARGTAGRVTCVDKANVFAAFAFFRKIFDETAAAHPETASDHAYVDATALNFVRRPWDYDVMVTENMFGDILSDLGAGLIGGLGMAPSADIGDDHAVFQPCHGTAPDIAGQGLANPTAMFLSAAMMLDWLSDRAGVAACETAGRRIQDAVDAAFADGALTPSEMGGTACTKEIAEAVMAAAV